MKWLLVTAFVFFSSFAAAKSRIGDLISIDGVRTNALIGYGLVVGLNGTGDSATSLMSRQTTSRLLNHLGVAVTDATLASGSYAAVIVTAELPPFARSGDRLPVRVSTIGNAKSIGGGTLVMTHLRAGNSQVYAVAQGAVIFEGKSKTITVTTLPDAGFIEKNWTPRFHDHHTLRLTLKRPHSLMAQKLSDVINDFFRGKFALAKDQGQLTVTLPLQYRTDDGVVRFLAQLESLTLDVQEDPVVVVQEQTGTVVLGHSVTIAPITVAHKGWSFTISPQAGESRVPVSDLVKSLHDLGAKPTDFVAIFSAISSAGALGATLRLE